MDSFEKKLKSTGKQMWRSRISYAFIAPYFILFVIFTMIPVLISIYYSFTYFNILETPKFIGFDNYVKLLLRDDVFRIAIKNTFILALFTGPSSYLLCFLTAWFINELTPKVRAWVTLVFYAPSISGNVYLVWKLLFSGDSYGYVNGFLLKLGIINEPIIFMKDKAYMMPLVALIILWMSLGTSFLSFIAGFQGIDKVYYEAAAVDGVKNRWQELWFVTLPMMKPQLMFSAVMTITGSFGVGAVVTELFGFPSTDYAAHTIMNHLQDYGSTRFDMGYASAIATLLFLVMLMSNIIIQKLIAKVGQ